VLRGILRYIWSQKTTQWALTYRLWYSRFCQAREAFETEAVFVYKPKIGLKIRAPHPRMRIKKIVARPEIRASDPQKIKKSKRSTDQKRNFTAKTAKTTEKHRETQKKIRAYPQYKRDSGAAYVHLSDKCTDFSLSPRPRPPRRSEFWQADPGTCPGRAVCR
jgi:hypothetical protein